MRGNHARQPWHFVSDNTLQPISKAIEEWLANEGLLNIRSIVSKYKAAVATEATPKEQVKALQAELDAEYQSAKARWPT